MSPSVSVIIPTYKDHAGLRHSLEALARQDYAGAYEVIVVDNAPEFTLEAFASDWPSVTFLWEPTAGSYNARNKGLASATGEILAFTDSDCRPHADWISQAVAALTSGADMVGGRVRTVLEHAGSPSLAERFELLFAFPQRTYVEQSHFAVTANMVTRRPVIEAVGQFNGALKSGGDSEFGRRVHAQGFAQAYVHASVVDHPARASVGELYRKVRRTAGGHRDRTPGWNECWQNLWVCLPPPMGRFRAILGADEPKASLPTKWALIALTLWLQWAFGFERLRLQLTGAASPRS